MAQQGNDIVTNGGRVLCVTALGDSACSTTKAAQLAERIHWNDVYRRDIGWRAIKRESRINALVNDQI